MKATRVLQSLLIVGLVGAAVVVGVSALGPGDAVVVSPMATVDDVYSALSTQMGGATPDFDTQVKPVLDRNLTYQQLHDLVQNGGLADILSAPAAPAVNVAPAPTAKSRATVVPTLTHTVAMTAVVNIIRSQWDTQPQPVCTGSVRCVNHTPLTSLTCDRTGDIAVPVNVSCAYVDPTIVDPTTPGAVSVIIDANNAVTWRGCSTDPGTHFYQLCLQAAPTTPPVVAPPAGPVTNSYCGREWITVSILDGRPHPVWIYIDGSPPLGPNIVNTYRVSVGAHVVYWIYNDGSRSQNDNVYVPSCGYALIKIN